MTGHKKFSDLSNLCTQTASHWIKGMGPCPLLHDAESNKRKQQARERLMTELGEHAGRTGADEYFAEHMKDPHYKAAYEKARKI